MKIPKMTPGQLAKARRLTQTENRIPEKSAQYCGTLELPEPA